MVTLGGKMKLESNHQFGNQGAGTKSASSMAAFDAFSVGEFPDVIVAGATAIETGLNAGAKVFDLGEEKVDLRCDTSYVETVDVYRQRI